MTDIIAQIQAGISLDAKFFPPGTAGYGAATSSYFWSNSRVDPIGVFQPATPRDVVFIFTILVRFPDLRFAVKAGSHIAPTGFNSTAGLLIDMSLFKAIDYNSTTQLADVGPGLLWSEVYTFLKDKERVVNGATSCQGVGVAGFNLGGGYGNRVNQYGLTMDTVKAIEVVLPTGRIMVADANRNPEMFWALKGGGNNFGIVTKWTMTTYPLNAIYSKGLVFTREQFEDVKQATWAYIQKQVQKADVGSKFEWTTTTEDETPLARGYVDLFYDGETPPEGLFDEFLAIRHRVVTQATTFEELMRDLPASRQTYGGLARGLYDLPENFRGRYTHVMINHYTPALIDFVVERAEEIGKILDPDTNGGLQLYPAVKLGHPDMFQNSPPSAWPRPPNRQASFPLPIRCLWYGIENDAFWITTLRRLTDDIHTFAVSEGCTSHDAPVYYNLALDDANVGDIYRGNLPQLQAMRLTLDPLAIMDRTGGFRIPLP